MHLLPSSTCFTTFNPVALQPSLQILNSAIPLDLIQSTHILSHGSISCSLSRGIARIEKRWHHMIMTPPWWECIWSFSEKVNSLVYLVDRCQRCERYWKVLGQNNWNMIHKALSDFLPLFMQLLGINLSYYITPVLCSFFDQNYSTNHQSQPLIHIHELMLCMIPVC